MAFRFNSIYYSKMKTKIIIICFFIAQVTLSQNKSYGQYDKVYNNSIELNFYKNKSELGVYIFGNDIRIPGDLKVIGNTYKCTLKTFQEISLLRIDNYRLLVLNKNWYFRQGEILYCNIYEDQDKCAIEEGMYWENGLREGRWEKIIKNKGIMYTEWKKGRRMKVYFKSNKQIFDDSKTPAGMVM